MTTNKFKGVSPVIATVLMVMVTVGLVAFSYTFLSGIITTGGEAAKNQTKILVQNQQIGISSLWRVDATHTGIAITSTGTSAVDLSNVKVFINNAPKAWLGDSVDGCTLAGTLSPQESCNMDVAAPYTQGSVIKIVGPSGTEVTRTIS